MLDIKRIRDNPEIVQKSLKNKESDADVDIVLTIDRDLRTLKTQVEELKSRRNTLSKEIGQKKRGGKACDDLMESASKISEEIQDIDAKVAQLSCQFDTELARLPNLPDPDIKVSGDPEDNILLRSWGQKTSFNFEPKNHLELNERLKLFDFKRGAKISGTGWPVYRNFGARLEWALLNFMLDHHLENGYTFWLPPHLARPEVLLGSGQLPKFENQQFKVKDEDYHLYLIPTAEVVLNGLHIDEIISEEDLPFRYVSYTPCFRREAGAGGAGERGLIRVHQFNKVEMFCFTTPEESENMLEEMCESAENLLKKLDLYHRTMLLVTGDMSFCSAKTLDIEVWLPGQGRYYEVSSVSNCRDYQARRSKTRYRKKGEKPDYLHTLNGSGLATARLMVALLENNQNPDGSVNIPEVLQKYLGGKSTLTVEERT